MLHKTLLAGLLALGVVAEHGYVAPLPVNGYLGNLNSQITCKAVGTNITFGGEFAALGPLVMQSGQQFYANDVALNLTVPQALTAGANLIGAQTVNALVFIDILSENLTPTDYNVFPQGRWFNGSKLNGAGPSILPFPAKGVLSGFGPFTAGEPGLGIVYLGTVRVELYLIGAFGNVISGPVEAICSPPQYNAVLATFNIVEKEEDNPPIINISNGPNLIHYPVIQPNTQFGCLSFQYDCSVGPYYPLSFNIEACGVVGGFYDLGETFTIANISSKITIPAALAQSLTTLYPGTKSFEFDAQSLDIMVTNTIPSSMNGIPAGGSNQTVALPPSGDVTFYLPKDGYFNVGQFLVTGTPGNENLVKVMLGNTTAHLTFFDASHNKVGDAAVSCQTHYPNLTFIGVTIAPPSSQSFQGLTGI